MQAILGTAVSAILWLHERTERRSGSAHRCALGEYLLDTDPSEEGAIFVVQFSMQTTALVMYVSSCNNHNAHCGVSDMIVWSPPGEWSFA